MAGAPVGNNNATKNKPWRDAIDRALKIRSKSRVDGKKALDELAERLLQAAEDGEGWALKELGDRLEGKPAQSLTVGGDEENPLTIETITRKIVKPDES